ncbi:MAG: hypothetical protein U0232_08515 [Thermomicrobiales bacterium]
MLRLVPLVVVLALVLSACGFSTDTVATVGGERITRGELNAAVQANNAALTRISEQIGTTQRVAPADVLTQIANSRRLELVARDNKVRVTLDDFATSNAQLRDSLVGTVKNIRVQQLTQYTADTAGTVRPIINTYGGNVIPNAELQTIVSDEIGRIRQALASRGSAVQIGISSDNTRQVKDEAIAFRNVFAAHGIAVPPERLEPVVSDMLHDLDQVFFLGSDADLYQLASNPNVLVELLQGDIATYLQLTADPRRYTHDSSYYQKLQAWWSQQPGNSGATQQDTAQRFQLWLDNAMKQYTIDYVDASLKPQGQ